MRVYIIFLILKGKNVITTQITFTQKGALLIVELGFSELDSFVKITIIKPIKVIKNSKPEIIFASFII